MLDDNPPLERKRDFPGPVRIVFSLLSRGSATAGETSIFADVPHEELVKQFRSYLDRHRHFFGSYQLEESHSLNEKGVDLLLRSGNTKVGFQIKSHYDVQRPNFAESVKRQLAESSVHRLDHYFILICAPHDDAGKDLSKKITHLLMELSLMETLNQTAYGPTNTVRLFQGHPPLTRDELIRHRVIDHTALFADELGYEHLPDVEADQELQAAEERLDTFGDDWFDSDEGTEAFDQLQQLHYKKLGEQYERDYLPTIPPETRQKREGLVTEILTLLEEARRCKSWDEKSEYKLGPWIEDVPEDMIAYTSIPNLVRIKENLKQYRDLHLRTDKEMEEAKGPAGADSE